MITFSRPILAQAFLAGADILFKSGYETDYNYALQLSNDDLDNFVDVLSSEDNLFDCFHNYGEADFIAADIAKLEPGDEYADLLAQLAYYYITYNDFDAQSWRESDFNGHDYYQVLGFLYDQADILLAKRLIQLGDFDGQDFLRGCFVDGWNYQGHQCPSPSEVLSAMRGDKKAARLIRRTIYNGIYGVFTHKI